MCLLIRNLIDSDKLNVGKSHAKILIIILRIKVGIMFYQKQCIVFFILIFSNDLSEG